MYLSPRSTRWAGEIVCRHYQSSIHHLQVLKDEKLLQDEFKMLEKFEREYFSGLSNAVRDSHEKERAQAEKTKYWSVLGSIIGTCIGIFGTTINNRMRMNELRRLVSQNNPVEEIRAIGTELKDEFKGMEARRKAHEERQLRKGKK